MPSQDYYRIKATKYSTLGNTDGYCQFTGGGEIVIEAAEVPLTIVDHLDPPASPKFDDETISSVTIEGKRMDWEKEYIKCQLFANIIYNFCK